MYRLTIALTVSIAVVSALPSFPRNWKDFESSHESSMVKLFESYKESYSKKFSSIKEEVAHFTVFSENVNNIFNWNAETGHSYVKGITKFTDLSDAERAGFVMKDTIAAEVIWFRLSQVSLIN